MATDPNEHPAHKVPEKFPLPPGDLPPSTEPPTLPPQPQLPDGSGPDRIYPRLYSDTCPTALSTFPRLSRYPRGGFWLNTERAAKVLNQAESRLSTALIS